MDGERVMLALERLQYIEDLLKRNKVVLVSDLSREIHVTEETIRKDLEKLEERKILCRVHGGAYLKEGYGREAPVSVRAKIYRHEKEKLAMQCLEHIAERDSLILDCSTTSLHIARQLAERGAKCTVVTNSMIIAEEISKSANIRLLMLGGRLDRDTDSFCGQVTVEALDHYHVDKVFISSAGISGETGVTDYTQEESDLRRAMIAHGDKCYFVADDTKIGRNGLFVTADLKQLHALITENPLEQMDAELKLRLDSLGVMTDYCGRRKQEVS